MTPEDFLLRQSTAPRASTPTPVRATPTPPARATPTPPAAASAASATAWGRRAGPPPPELARQAERDADLPDYSDVYRGLRRSEAERSARDPEFLQRMLDRHAQFAARTRGGENALDSYDYELFRWQNRYAQGPGLLRLLYDGAAGTLHDLHQAGVEVMYLGMKYRFADLHNGSTAAPFSPESQQAAQATRDEATREALDLAVVSGAKALSLNNALVRSLFRWIHKGANAATEGFVRHVVRDPEWAERFAELDERNAYETALANYQDEKTAANFHRDVTSVAPALVGILGTTEVNQDAAAGLSNLWPMVGEAAVAHTATQITARTAARASLRSLRSGEFRAAEEALAEQRRALAHARTLRQTAKAAPQIEGAGRTAHATGERVAALTADIAEREAAIARARQGAREEVAALTGAATANRAATRRAGTLGEAVEATSDLAERLEALPAPHARQIMPEGPPAGGAPSRPLVRKTGPDAREIDFLRDAAEAPVPAAPAAPGVRPPGNVSEIALPSAGAVPDAGPPASPRALPSAPFWAARPLAEAGGRAARSAVAGGVSGAAFGALTNPDDPLAGAFSGAGGGTAFGAGLGLLSQWRIYESPGQVRREQAGQRRAYRSLLEMRPDEAVVFDQLPESTQTAIAHYSAANPDLIIRYIDDPQETAGRYSSAESGRVTINRAAKEPLEQVFAHEAGHAIAERGLGPTIERALLGDAEAGVPGQYTLRDADGAPVLAPDGQSYAVNAEFESQRQRYLDRLDAHAMQAGWSAERHAAARRPYSDPHHVARELAAEQYAQYLASPEYRRDLKGGARGGYFELGEIVGNVPFLQNSLGRLGFVFDRTGGIVHSPLFGDYRKSPAIAQAVREYTRARGRAKTGASATEQAASDSAKTARSPDGDAPTTSSFYPGETDGGTGKGFPSDDPSARQDFHAAITAATQGLPAGLVEVKAPEFYADPKTQLFLSPERRAGVAIGSDRYLVSAFGPEAELRPLLAAAAQRATKLNAHVTADGAMLKLYSEAGFRPVARARFDPDILYGEWSYAELGKPEMVFMVRDWRGDFVDRALGDNSQEVLARIPLAESYEQAVEWQKAAIRAPVSSAMHVIIAGKQGPHVKQGLLAIDRLHDDGDLPPTTVEDFPNAPVGVVGRYEPVEWKGRERIRVRESSESPAITGLHETGHQIDYRALGEPGDYASISHPGLEEFRIAVAGTDAVKKLKRLSFEDQQYYLLPEELWARAYSQFIAKRSGDSHLLTQLDLAATDLDGSYWTDSDFVPVDRAISNLFKQKGWLK